MTDWSRTQTSAEVWAVIHARHRHELKVLASFSNPDGRAFGGNGERGEMETTYGFSGCDYPFMEVRTTWDIDPEQPYKRVNEKHVYWLLLPIEDKE